MRTSEQTRAFLAERRTVIGASDVPAILGVSPWKSPLQVYAEKTGVAEISAEETEYMEWGHRLEEAIGRKWCEVHGADLDKHDRTRMNIITGETDLIVHPDYPFLGVHPDFLIVHPDMGDGAIQAKTSSIWKASEWEDGIPLYYQVQCQAEIMVLEATMDLQWHSLAVLFGGNQYRDFENTPHRRIQKVIAQKCEAFWDRVQRHDPPPVTPGMEEEIALALLFPDADPGKVVRLDHDLEEATDMILHLQNHVKEQEGKIRDLKNQVREAMGEAKYGALPSGGGWSWPTIRPKDQTCPHCSEVIKEGKAHRRLSRVKNIPALK